MVSNHTPQYKDDPQITRARIADLAGITRPTVTVWEGRFPDFPSPRKAGGTDYFLQSDVLHWLDGRRVPRHLRRPEEGEEATYGARARQALVQSEMKPHQPAASPVEPQERPARRPARSGNVQLVRTLMGPLADQVRGPGSMVNYLHLLLALHFLRIVSGARWIEVRTRAAAFAAAGGPGAGSELLEHIGREIDGEVRRLGMLPHFTDSLADLVPKNAEVLSTVVGLVGKLDRDAFDLIIDEYETHARLRSREFFTPKGVVRLMAALAGNSATRAPRIAYDPYVRGGECLAEGFAFSELLRQRHPEREPLKVFGQTPVDAAGLLASLNLALRGVQPGVRLESKEPWAGALDSAGRADLVLTNPPFNMKNSAGQARRTGTWPYGAPPLDNDNFAYVQHVLASLREGGRAAMVMPTKAGNSASAAETAIRRAMVDAGVVECVVALPARLFSGTAVPVSVWLLRHPGEPCAQVLFLDARHLGTRKGPRSVLAEDGVRDLLDAYWAHSAPPSRHPDEVPEPPRNVPSALVDRKALLDGACSLNPVDHIGPAARPADRQWGSGEDTAKTAERAWEEVARLRERCADMDAHADSSCGQITPGEMSGAAWRTQRLADLCEIKAGPSFTQLGTKDRGPAGMVPVVLPRHLREGRIIDTGEERISPELALRLAHFKLKAGDIVCVRAGKPGPPAIVGVGQAGWLPTANLTRLRVREDAEVDPAYLLAWLSRPEALAWVEDRAAATAASSISTGSLGRLEVRLPPLPEQRRITELLADLEEQALAHRELAAAVSRARGLLAEQVMNPTPPA